MGGGASKNELDPGYNRERRPSHIDTNPPPQSDLLVECPHCQRSFASDRIDRHVEVCAKQQAKKREVFDMSERRLEGTLAEDYKDKITEVEKRKDRGEWKKKHEDMIEAIRAAKKGPRPASALDPPVQLLA